jgi:hypothetical protein
MPTSRIASSAADGCRNVARVFDQDPPHGLGGGPEEVPAAVPVHCGIAVDQPQIGLMNEGCGLVTAVDSEGIPKAIGVFPLEEPRLCRLRPMRSAADCQVV